MAFAASVGGQTLDLMSGRGFVPHTHLPNGDDPTLDALINSPLNAQFKQIVVSRSLLLSDCATGSTWCGDARFGFASVLPQAAQIGYPDARLFLQAWYDSMLKADQAYGAFQRHLGAWRGNLNDPAMPFQLLAIVNRMDLAEWDGTVWKKAELRFVYGPKPLDDGIARNCQLIVEFVLPPFCWRDFRTLAQSWRSLSDANGTPLPDRIASLVTQSRMDASQSARIRLNYEQNGPQWALAQWDFEKDTKRANGGSLQQSNLTDEITMKYWGSQPGSQEYADYIKLWPLETIHIPSQGISVPSIMLTAVLTPYRWDADAMPTPVNRCVPSEQVRDTLALQRCSGCHGTESATVNQQITNRTVGGSSELSQFLTGGNLKPLIEDLYRVASTAVFSTTVDYKTYVGLVSTPSVCNQLTSKSEVRYYNDLARRSLFLAALLAASDKPEPNPLAQLNEFRTNFPD